MSNITEKFFDNGFVIIKSNKITRLKNKIKNQITQNIKFI